MAAMQEEHDDKLRLTCEQYDAERNKLQKDLMQHKAQL